jgi:hypothetical protein
MAQTTTSPGADDPATPGDRRASNSDDESSGTSVSPHDVPDLREGCLSHREESVALGRLDVPVGIGSDGDRGVPQLPTDDVERDATPEHLGSVSVPEFVDMTSA